MDAEQVEVDHLVISDEELARGVDQTSPEWRMAYAIATEDHAERRRQARLRRRRAFGEGVRERRRGTARFLALLAVLSLTAVTTTLAMFRVLYWTLS